MDRKLCILVYSNFSQASITLIEYIKNLPIDFPTFVGLTLFNVDSDVAKTFCIDNDIQYVPTLLIEYYNGQRQKLEKHQIYSWINQIFTVLQRKSIVNYGAARGPSGNAAGPKDDENYFSASTTTSTVKARRGSSTEKKDEPLWNEAEGSQCETKKTGRKDITSLAMEMQKSREADLATLKEQQKPI